MWLAFWFVSLAYKEAAMVKMMKKVGDRELAWVMLAVAAVALWSTWGLNS